MQHDPQVPDWQALLMKTPLSSEARAGRRPVLSERRCPWDHVGLCSVMLISNPQSVTDRGRGILAPLAANDSAAAGDTWNSRSNSTPPWRRRSTRSQALTNMGMVSESSKCLSPYS